MQADLITFADRQYLRTGACDGCGLCCTFMVLPERPLTPDETKWLRLHDGAETLYLAGATGRIDIPCSALSDGKCSLYGSPERPEMCGRYPEMPEQLIDGCKYTLTEV